MGLLGRLGVHGGGSWPSSWASIQAPGAVGAPSSRRLSASTSSAVVRPHWHVSCDVGVRGGMFVMAQGELAGSERGVEAPDAGAVTTVGKAFEDESW